MHIPTVNANGLGCLSEYLPTNGCSTDDVIWNTNVMMPIWVNVSPNSPFNIGYIEGITDCTASLRRCAKLIAKSMENVVPETVFVAVRITFFKNFCKVTASFPFWQPGCQKETPLEPYCGVQGCRMSCQDRVSSIGWSTSRRNTFRKRLM